jgi:hypothetical protein
MRDHGDDDHLDGWTLGIVMPYVCNAVIITPAEIHTWSGARDCRMRWVITDSQAAVALQRPVKNA